MAMIAVNVCGAHITERAEASTTAEAGERMRWYLGKKERELVQMLKAGPHRGGAMVMADTHHTEEELARVVRYLREEEGLDACGTPGTYCKAAGRMTAGVMVVWDPRVVEVEPDAASGEPGREVVEGRVVRVEARMIKDDGFARRSSASRRSFSRTTRCSRATACRR